MIPVLSIVGYANSGKTTLIGKILPILKIKGLRVGVIKHAPHGFSADTPGKDSYSYKQAGANTTMVLSSKEMVIMRDISYLKLLDNNLIDLATKYIKGLDILITEGFKKEKWPKIEIFRSEIHDEPSCLYDPNLIAIVSNIKLEKNIPQFEIDDVTKISDFIMQKIFFKNKN